MTCLSVRISLKCFTGSFEPKLAGLTKSLDSLTLAKHD